jgi:hypothetical protein
MAGALCLMAAACGVTSAGVASAAPVLGVSVGHLSDEVQDVQIKAAGGTYRLAYTDPAGTTESTGAAGTGTLTALSTTIENVAATKGVFVAGEAISGPKIPAGATISAVNPAEHKITLSVPVQAGGSAAGVPLVADLSAAGSFATVAQRMQAALNAIPVLNAGGGSVTVREGNNQFPYEVVFAGGPLANTDVAELADSPGFTPLTAGADVNTKATTTFVWTARQGAIIGTGERLDYLLTVGNTGTSATSGPVTLEFSLPGGAETTVRSLAPIPGEDFEMGSSSNPGSSNGWTCSWQQASGGSPAKVTCTRSDALAPGASYPSLRIVTFLGADAASHPTAKAVVSGARR